ncbi:uncharacterized protein PG986_015022 [Apiospora aurea]|uniref:Major facilitator superfamily (MFS) profile domain-containing protein n=1 Tax=Apiospora aurea TaxID=335848 RepID=A0ABR1PRB9_9PEZI
MGSWPLLPRIGRGNILPFQAPNRYPKTRFNNIVVLMACKVFTAACQGYDGSLMGGLNILPQYHEYFHLTNSLRSLNIAINYTGGSLACFCWTWVTDTYGRRVGLFWAAAITIVAAILQAASVHIAMFCFSRVLIGFGNVASVITGAAYLAETLPWEQRAWGLALFDDFFYVGALVAAAATLAACRLPSAWAWRLPALLQCVWGAVCIALLPWMPESPRWLIDQGRGREALVVLARINAPDGDVHDDLVRLQFRQIFQTIEYERNPMKYREMLANRGARKRLIITATCALFSMLAGNLIVMYYIGDVLDHAGIHDQELQLVMNLGLNATSLVTSIVGTFYVDKRGVKSATLVSTGGCAISLFALGVLSKFNDHTDTTSDDYAAVFCTFLFAACYAFGWVPVLFLLPAEMLYFRIRALGMSMFSLVVCVTGIWGNFAMPLALQHLGWRLWIMNGAWNLFFFAFVWWYWIEIRGKTLEEIDALFDGGKRSSAPDVAEVLAGRADANWKEKMSTWMSHRFGRSEGPASSQDGRAVSGHSH